jgi:AraC-like DNA-binding protein
MRRALLLAERVVSLGRKLGLSVHFAVGAAPPSIPVTQSYDATLGAAESALIQGRRLAHADRDMAPAPHALLRLRSELAAVDEARPDLSRARFDHYADAVAHCAYRTDLARAHLDFGLERLTDALRARGALDERSLRLLVDRLGRSATRAVTASELSDAYRRAAREACEAVRSPTPARRDRSLREAIEYIRAHYAERLSRKTVARVAGFAPGYFTELFKERERVPFERYLFGLRIERAKQLLDGTDLRSSRVAELSGFRSASYFIRAFRRATGTTPLAYRRSMRGHHEEAGSPPRVSD